LKRVGQRVVGASGVAVPVVQVRIVRMLMREDAVAVFMGMGFCSVPRKIVLALMMCVVDVRCA